MNSGLETPPSKPPDNVARELELGRRWWHSRGTEGEPAYLAGFDGRGLNLAEQHLASAVLVDADLSDSC